MAWTGGDHFFQALLPGPAFGLFQLHRGGEAREAAQERAQGVLDAGLLLFEPLVHQGEKILKFQALPVIEELHLDLFLEPVLEGGQGPFQIMLELAAGAPPRRPGPGAV